jgi:hypothetical protein
MNKQGSQCLEQVSVVFNQQHVGHLSAPFVAEQAATHVPFLYE